MVLCPYEPRNLVLKSKLDDHLKTCPKKRELDEIASKQWYTKHINFMNPNLPSCFDNLVTDETKLANVDKSILTCIATKIEQFYSKMQKEHSNDPNMNDLFKSVDHIH